MALTKEQIKGLKPGDPLVIHGEYIKNHGDGDIIIKCNITRSRELTTDRKYVHPSCVSLPSEYKTVVDARDIFRNMSEGEKACVNNFLASYFRERKKQEEMHNSLKKMGIDLTNIRPKHDPCRPFRNGDIVRYVERDGRSYVDAPPVGATCCVCVGEDSVGMVSVEFKFSENEEPAVHDVPFYHLELVTPVEELEPYYVERQDSCYVVGKRQESPEMEYVAGFSKTRHPNAKAAAEAERDRLNAEWIKKQGK